MVGFFVGDADPSTANQFRDLRDGVADDRDRALDALDDACTTDDDWERAAAAATTVVEAAYDDYVETLESMGVKPKNVC
jgi:membrane-bound ClpP family serine protease